MPEAARIGDTTLHDGTVTSGFESVEIGNSPASRFLDVHCCEMTDPDGRAHVGGDIVQGSETVIIGNMPAARVGDECICYGPPVTADVPAPSSSSSSSSSPTITTEVETHDDSGTDSDGRVSVGLDGAEAEGHASARWRAQRIQGRVRAGGYDVAGAHGGYELGTAEARGRGRVGLNGASGQGSASARSGAVRGGFHLGDRDNPAWAEEGEIAGPGASVSRGSSRSTDGVGEHASGGLEGGSVTRRTRLTTPTVRGQNIQLATEGSGGYSMGGMLGGGIYRNEGDGRTHIRGRADSSAILAIVTGGLGALLPGPSLGFSFDLSWGRAYGSAGGTAGGPPTLPPFAAGPNEIVTGEDTVLIGD